MPLYHVIKTYEVEARDPKEAGWKVDSFEETNEQWLVLKKVRVQEVPWPEPDEV